MKENFLKSICYQLEIQLELKFCQVWGKKENDFLDLYINVINTCTTPLLAGQFHFFSFL